MTNATPPTRASRACDGCRIRKVKCDGNSPCSQCAHFDVQCVVTPPSKRKNPIRGRLVAKVRGEEASFNIPQDASTSPNTVSNPQQSPSDKVASPQALTLFDGLRNPTGYTPDFFMGLLPQFDELVYPVNPVITSTEIAAAIGNMDHSYEDAALVYAFGSMTTFLAQTSQILPGGGVSTQMNELMQCSLEAHKRAELRIGSNGRLVEAPAISLKRIMTCIYLEVSMMAFKRFDRSFSLLREAITMLQTYQADDAIPEGSETVKFQRLYWEAFIHERFLTIASSYPSVLPPLSSGFPDPDLTIPAHIDLGFNRLVSLFRIIDRQFLSYWTQDENELIPALTSDWIEKKQAQLDKDEREAMQAESELRASGRGGLTELQHADLFITRLWVRTIVWQLALSHGLLRSGPPQDHHEGLSLHFPAQRLSTQLRSLVSRLESFASISTQGSGIVQKLFEITSTVADVLALSLGHGLTDHEINSQVEDLFFLVRFLFNFERIRDHQKDYLREKLNILRYKYPTVALYELP